MNSFEPDPAIIALGVRQPWAELILRGIKTIEVRSTDTRVRGTIYLYASKKLSDLPAATEAARRHDVDLENLPLGLLVGSVELQSTRPCETADAASCVPAAVLRGRIGWQLGRAIRFERPVPVRFLPYGVWFYPFRRRGSASRRRPA